MPHFTLGVLIPPHVTDINDYVDRQVDPFDSGFPSSNCGSYRLIRRSDEWVTGTGPWLADVQNKGCCEGDTFETDPEVLDHAFVATERALANGVIPHAIITPKGKWHDHYNIWGPSDYEDREDFPAWDKTARRILRRHPGHRMMILVTKN